MNIDKLLTQREVSQRLGVSRKTLQTLRRNRKIGYVQFGHRTIRFRESDVQTFIAKRERNVLPEHQPTPAEVRA